MPLRRLGVPLVVQKSFDRFTEVADVRAGSAVLVKPAAGQ
jgi:hypothetical protein